MCAVWELHCDVMLDFWEYFFFITSILEQKSLILLDFLGRKTKEHGDQYSSIFL